MEENDAGDEMSRFGQWCTPNDRVGLVACWQPLADTLRDGGEVDLPCGPATPLR
jgi:hypothetical protein